MLVIKMLVKRANRGDPDQTASSVRLGLLGRQLVLFVLFLYVASQQLWSWQDGKFT